MYKMGFVDSWISWIMRCVNSVLYKVLINGNPTCCINFEKSTIIFSKQVSNEDQIAIKQRLEIPTEGGNGMYLKIPEQLKRSKAQIFTYVRDRLNHIINGWSAKLLSKGGKEVLIKYVA